MPIDPDSGVRLLGDVLPYADGAEDQLAQVMAAADDRSSLSDELPASIVDWPTRYHLSRLRSNLLRPLRLPAGARVLDVGAGTGALSRYLGEQGLDVVALEGSLDRARVAASRCADLPDVEVVCGPVADFEDADGFDLVVVCGVLEYAHAVIGGEASAASFLDHVRSLCRPDGTLVLAIENRLGLKYLLGYAEDHLGRPWIGLEGYPDEPGVRTWSRRQLGQLLGDAGFGAQRWLFPFPDYKLPVTVLAEPAYDQPDAVRLVDQLVSLPVLDYANPAQLLTDDRAAHGSLVEGGLGPEVANSLLVVASATDAGPDALVDPDVLAWRFGDERRRPWLRTTVVRADGDGRHVTQVRPDGGADADEQVDGWLRQVLVPEAPYHRGPTLQQLALEAARRHDLDELRAVLRRWRDHLRTLEAPVGDAVGAHPFVPDGTVAVLPEDHLDVAFDNFVATDDGLAFIDPEWQLAGGVAVELAVDRALWGLARRFVTTGVEQPWALELTVDELTAALGAMVDEDVTAERLERWWVAEAQLQERVRGEDPEVVAGEHRHIGSLARTSLAVSRHLPFTRLQALAALLPADDGTDEQRTIGVALREGARADERLQAVLAEQNTALVELREDLVRVVAHGDRLETELDHARLHASQLEDARQVLGDQVGELTREVHRLEGHVASLEATVVEVSADRDDVRADRDRIKAEAAGLRAALEHIYRQLPYRVYSKTRRVLAGLRHR